MTDKCKHISQCTTVQLTYGGDNGNNTCTMTAKCKHMSWYMTVHDACAMIDNRKHVSWYMTVHAYTLR